MNEFELTLRLKNNLIKSRRVGLGLSPRQAAGRAGISYSIWLQFEALVRNPIGKRLKWSPAASKIAAFLGCTEEELFPDAVLAVKNPVVVAEIKAEQALALAKMKASLELTACATDADVDDQDLRKVCRLALARLSGRDRELVEDWLTDVPIIEMAKKLDLSVTRVYQLLENALRRIRDSRTVMREFEAFR